MPGSVRNRLWTPKDILPSVSCWLDASDLNTIVLNGTNVAQWRDKSLRGNNLVQNTALNQPAYNGLPGNQAALTTSALASMSTSGTANVPNGSADRSLFCLVAPKSVNAGIGTCSYWFQNGGGGAIRTGFNLQGNNGGLRPYLNAVGSSDRDGGAVATYNKQIVFGGTNLSQTAWGGVWVVGLNGIILNAGNGSGSPNTTAGPVGFNAGAIADIHEIVLLNIAADAALRQVIEGYLAWKWGTTSALANTHKYRLKPPQFSM